MSQPTVRTVWGGGDGKLAHGPRALAAGAAYSMLYEDITASQGTRPTPGRRQAPRIQAARHVLRRHVYTTQ